MVYRLRFLVALILLILWSAQNAQALNLIRDSEIETVLGDISRPLIKASGLSEESIKIHIYSSDDLNAFVAGGQNIFISSELIAFSHDPELLAGVIAHELGHIKAGHLHAFSRESKNAQKKLTISTLAGILAVVASGGVGGVGASAASQDMIVADLMKFSRAQESAADMIGVKTLNKVGVSSTYLISFLDHLHKNEDKFSNKKFQYLRSHPLSIQRIENISQRAKYKKNEGFPSNLRAKFRTISLKTALFTKDLQDLKHAEFNDNYLGAIVQLRFARYERAEKLINTAISVDSKNRFLYELLGEIYKEQGKFKQATQAFKTAYELDRSDNLIAILYAESALNAGIDSDLSKKMVEKAITSDGQNIMAWGLLARVNMKQGKNDQMSLSSAWGEYIKGDIGLAQKHYNTVQNNKFGGDRFYIRHYTQLGDLLKHASHTGDES